MAQGGIYGGDSDEFTLHDVEMTDEAIPPYHPARVGRRIRALREHLGISQKDLAERCNVTAPAVGNWEQGRQRPTIAQAQCLCDVPGVTLDYIFLGRAELMPHGLAIALAEIESRIPAKRSRGRPPS